MTWLLLRAKSNTLAVCLDCLQAILQLVADPRNLVLKKCACPSFYVVNYADLLSKAQNMHTLHYFKMHTSFLLSIENNLIEDRNTYVLEHFTHSLDILLIFHTKKHCSTVRYIS